MDLRAGSSAPRGNLVNQAPASVTREVLATPLPACAPSCDDGWVAINMRAFEAAILPVATLVLTLLTTGCGDPIVGVWRGEDTSSCGATGDDTVDFVVESDLTGQGEVCGCEFSFELIPEGTGDYQADVNFRSGCFAADGIYNCGLSEDGLQLDCGLVGEFVRAD